MSGQLTMYTTPWCGFCRNLKRQLARDGIEMIEVDIERDAVAAEFVMSVNGGNQTVPTVAVPGRHRADQPVGRAGQGPARRPARAKAVRLNGVMRTRARLTGSRQVGSASGETDGIVVRRSDQGWQVGGERRPT